MFSLSSILPHLAAKHWTTQSHILLCINWSWCHDAKCKCFFFFSCVVFKLYICWLADEENHLWQVGWEIITWLWSSSTHRQDKNITEGPARQPVKAVCTPSFQEKCPPSLIIPSSSLSYLPLPIHLIHSHFLNTHAHTQTMQRHTPTNNPASHCVQNVQLSHPFSRQGSQHDQSPCISLSADQRATKQPETTEGARPEHAQQHN